MKNSDINSKSVWFEFKPCHATDDGTLVADHWHIYVGGAFICRVQDRKIADIIVDALSKAKISS